VRWARVGRIQERIGEGMDPLEVPACPRRTATRFSAASLALLALACVTETRSSASETAASLGFPTPVPAQVRLIAERDGRYLDVAVDTQRSALRFFFPATDTCRFVVTGSGEARYSSHGPYGRLGRGAAHCDPVGLLALPAWQKRRPRQTSGGRSPIPRDTARYEIVYSDEDVFFARGRFQLAGMVGWAGGYDTLAIFPNQPECEGLLERGSATMEYRDAGRQPLVLLNGRQRCPFLGFAMPSF
jgi:hypothetical protein